MRRKVVQQGHNTMMVSLPAKWVKENGVKKGDEVEIGIDGKKLTLSSSSAPTEKRIVLDFRKQQFFARRFINIPTRVGYDEIKVFFFDKKQLQKILDEVKNHCMGYEVVSVTPEFALIKRYAADLDDQFPLIMGRYLYSILDLFNILLTLETPIKKEDYESFIEQEFISNRLAIFCKRAAILGHTDGKYNITTYYGIFSRLEELGDYCKEMIEYLYRFQSSFSVKHKTYLKTIIDHYRTLISLIHHYDQAAYMKHIEHEKSLDKELHQALFKEDTPIMSILISLLWEIKHASEDLYQPSESV